MAMSSGKTIFAATVLAATALSGCGDARVLRGYVFDAALADAILPGVDNRQSVLDTLGSPTTRDVFENEAWYYVSTEVRVRPIYWPDAKKHRVLAVSFNEQGYVANVQNFGLDDMRTISPVDDKTPTKGRELNIFQQIFQSVGQFGGQPAGGNPNAPTGPNG